MRFKWLIIGPLLFAPGVVLGSWFTDFFGGGKIATAVADITKAGTDLAWHMALLTVIERNFSKILLGFIILAAVLVLLGTLYLIAIFFESCRDSVRDGKVTTSEWILIGLQFAAMTPIVLLATDFGQTLVNAARSGLGELMAK